MALTKVKKEKIIEDLKEKIEKQKSIVFLDISGLKVKDLSQLRKEMREKDCQLKVAKKTLIERAFKAKGTEINTKKLEGEIALGFGQQGEISPFKISYNFSQKAENLKILGGIIEGRIIDKEKALILATCPSREELFARIVQYISTPISGLVNVLQGNIRNLIYLFSRIESELKSR